MAKLKGILLALAPLCLLSATPETTADIGSCATTPDSPQKADQIISRCTTLIASGNLQGDALALAYAGRASAYRFNSRYILSLKDEDQAAELNPEPTPFLFDRAVDYFELRLFSRAVKDLDRFIPLMPQYGPAFLCRGESLLEMGFYDDAIRDFYVAILLQTSLEEAYCGRGVAYLELRQLDKALADLDQAIRLKPDLAPAYFARARLYAIQRKLDLALDDVNKAIRLKSDWIDAVRERDEIESMQQAAAVTQSTATALTYPNAAAAIHVPSMAVAGTHSCTAVYPILSRRLQEMGNVIVNYDVAVDGTISNVGLVQSSGYDRLDQAALWCVATLFRNSPARESGTAVASNGHKVDIQYLLRQPIDDDTFRGRGIIHLGMGRYLEATEDFDQLIARQPSDVDAYIKRGIAFYLQNQMTRAIADFDHAVSLKADSKDAAEWRDLAQWKLTHPDKPDDTPTKPPKNQI